MKNLLKRLLALFKKKGNTMEQNQENTTTGTTADAAAVDQATYHKSWLSAYFSEAKTMIETFGADLKTEALQFVARVKGNLDGDKAYDLNKFYTIAEALIAKYGDHDAAIEFAAAAAVIDKTATAVADAATDTAQPAEGAADPAPQEEQGEQAAQ